MNDIIVEIVKAGIPVSVEWDRVNNYGICYLVDGFYKSGNVKLVETEGQLIARSRYGQIDHIETFRSIVFLNYQWWLDSRDRFDGWKRPDSRWLPLLIQEGLIEEKTETITTYTAKK